MVNVVNYVLICFSVVRHGVIGHNMEGFVIGGVFTRIKNYPHAAFLQSTCGTRSWICGSSVLNQRILLTAGHCVSECILEFKNTAKIFMGHQDLHKATVIRTVQNLIRHAGYNDVTAVNDIAMVSANKDIPLGKNIKRVVITKDFPSVYEAYVAGWGSTGVAKMSTVLKQVYQRLRSQETCNQHGRIHKGVFCCTGREESAPNGGDSGSGLIAQSFHQIGLVSYRVERLPQLLVYTNISYFYDWIKENSKTLYCSTTLKFDTDLEYY